MSESLKLRVVSRECQGHEVVVLELADIDGRPLPEFTPGAHIDLQLADGVMRPYSLCGPASQRQRYRLAILREPASRGGSQAAHRLAVGDVVSAGLPRNLFALHSAHHTVLVAGGIGITPLLAMAYGLEAEDRSFELHYCGRERDRLAFLAELAAVPWAQRVQLHLSGPEGNGRLDIGRVVGSARPDTRLYVCGPAGFMDAISRDAEAAGLARDRIHREHFQPPEQDASGEQSFEVQVAGSDIAVTVAPGQSIVAALNQAGVRVRVSCQQGVCGTCLANVLAGTPDHRDQYLTPEEREANDQIILCCSRASSPSLVIELFDLD